MLYHFLPSLRKSFVKNAVDCIFWTFIFFGAYLLFLARESSWEYPRFQGVISFLSALCIALPLVVYKYTRLHITHRRTFVHLSELLVALPLSLNGLGALYFFDMSFGYDSFAHFTSSGLAALLIFFVVGAWWKNDTIGTRTVLFFIAVVGAFLSGVMMELWEQSADFLFQTRTWGEIGQDPWYDTASDLFYNIMGISSAALLLFFGGKYWLHQLRRASPHLRRFAAGVKGRVGEEVRERARAGVVRLHHMHETVRVETIKTKKRLLRRSRKIARILEPL